eukprot:6208956-Pleurochrysis_carterae.AAC.1
MEKRMSAMSSLLEGGRGGDGREKGQQGQVGSVGEDGKKERRSKQTCMHAKSALTFWCHSEQPDLRSGAASVLARLRISKHSSDCDTKNSKREYEVRTRGNGAIPELLASISVSSQRLDLRHGIGRYNFRPGVGRSAGAQKRQMPDRSIIWQVMHARLAVVRLTSWRAAE